MLLLSRGLALAILSAVLLGLPARADKDKSGDDEVEPPAAAKAELKRLNGTYDVILFERDGAAYPAATLKTMTVILKDGDGSFRQGNEVYTSVITLSPNKKPREVDCVYTNGPLKGQTIKGIYKIEKGRFTCCYAGPGMERPKDFSAPVNSGRTLYAVERVKEKK